MSEKELLTPHKMIWKCCPKLFVSAAEFEGLENALREYHLQFKPSDEEIWDIVQEKYFRASVENKNERIRNDVTAMKHLRDKIFK